MQVCYQTFQRCLRWCIFFSSNQWEISWYWIQNNKMCSVNRETRLHREGYWIETLWISYPYGLNERKRNSDPNVPVGCSFPPIPRSRERSARYRNNVNFDNLKDMESIFNCIHNYTSDYIKNTFYHIRILLKNTRTKHLKKSILKFY